ncbi:MAG: hypothetical protein QOJ76_189 [Acidobacteriota bacterium]|jgi:hypothetical protein|nr:hypothetical protein [Acidobacteriota bacterium]
MNGGHSFTHGLLAATLRVALVAALVAAGREVYRRLPEDGRAVVGASEGQQGATLLRIRLRRAEVGFPVSAQKISVQLYPINMMAARNEFDSERRPGQRFEDFAARQMGDRQPLTAELDERGETTLTVPPGKWWVHAAVNGDRELTWRLPVNVSGREKTVELTPENAYTRAKKF